MKKNIVLIGYMGTGKSSVGVRLASALSASFVDTDQEIERKVQMTIKELFQVQGEEVFRTMETNLLKEYEYNLSNAVLSTGGGMPLRAENAKLLRHIGDVIFLKTSKEVTYQRVKHDTTRPLLQCANPIEAIEQMLKIREPIYEECANFVVETDGKSIEDLVNEILSVTKHSKEGEE